ncbi:S1 family peptidase [Candidatus Binatus sp.]|uniref:S1 family peptidase n=1 Tax=Candidatus Binatus sp. TaxID=2811406 RepID=UPI003CC5256D
MLRIEPQHCPIPEVLEDNRWGWTEYYIGIRGEPLLVNPRIRTCVAFLGRRHDGEERIVATGFFLSLKCGDLYFPYLVTAAHVIERTRSFDYSDDGIVYLYLNAKTGARFKTIRSEIKHWYFHPTNPAVDVAVLPFKMLPELDHTVLESDPPLEVVANPRRWLIDVGTDVFITGLFLRHFGRERNIPIVRTGTIAALPEEPVTFVKDDGSEQKIKAYLIETHSVGGLSGSPVFANPMVPAISESNIQLQARHIWIGLVSAHWDFDPDQPEQENINSGIAIVSPRESVMEVLDHLDLHEMRQKVITNRIKNKAPKFDDAGEPLAQKTRAPKPEDRISVPIPTRGQFEGDLAKAVRKRNKK